ncbi:hypothetical protein FDH86_gp006 [Arthrobacter phage Tank]|uniref:Uncharacterized protein n=1 Tax=Arthrobacter phage Tank TaxID=1772319 RepID=A0A0U4B720_9CAUD|nr:hypothetical protein FDH86_gp006 [Arthrobacter phage Tank]ALY10541.1 hypothetical protein TANK_6 [Arthrobacter phage Tank]
MNDYDLQGHHPGCPFDRNRPCICVYLRSWKPVADSRLAGPGILLMPEDFIRVTIPTPQNRDAARRAGLAKAPVRTGLMAQSANAYLTAHPEALYKARAEHWERQAGFWKSAARVFAILGVLSASVTAATAGHLAGWW